MASNLIASLSFLKPLGKRKVLHTCSMPSLHPSVLRGHPDSKSFLVRLIRSAPGPDRGTEDARDVCGRHSEGFRRSSVGVQMLASLSSTVFVVSEDLYSLWSLRMQWKIQEKAQGPRERADYDKTMVLALGYACSYLSITTWPQRI